MMLARHFEQNSPPEKKWRENRRLKNGAQQRCAPRQRNLCFLLVGGCGKQQLCGVVLPWFPKKNKTWQPRFSLKHV